MLTGLYIFVLLSEMGGTYSTGGVFVVKEKEKGSMNNNKQRRRRKNNDNLKKQGQDERFE